MITIRTGKIGSANIANRFQKIKYRCRHDIMPVLFPRQCPGCHELLPYGQLICTECEKALPFTREPLCYRCGKPISDENEEYCYDCRSYRKSFRAGRALLIYNDSTRPLMADFKYHNKRGLSELFTKEIIKKHGKTIESWDVDAIVPIPVHKNKKRARGYNQAELLARDLSVCMGVPYYADLLVRVQDTLPQKQFGIRDRLENLSHVFVLNQKKYGSPERLPNKVMLIDDIYTTGATMEGCTRILKNAGIKEVYIYSVCIGIARD